MWSLWMLSSIIFYSLNKYDMLRVTEEEENIGQDIYEMGSSAYNIENHPLKENKICKK